jgi:hypothetical protein
MADVNLIKSMVSRAEECLGAIKDGQTDLKALTEEAKELQISAMEMAAIKRIAKLRLDGQLGKARRQLRALEEVAAAAGVDLFGWQDSRE